MQTREGAAVGHLAERQQAVRVQAGGAGGRAQVEVGVQGAVVVYGGGQQKGAVRVRGQRTQRLLWASGRFTGVRHVATAVGPEAFHGG